jgi:type I restriction enzyme R subunit
VTDLIRLVRYELQRDGELVPYRDVVEERYQGWLLRQEQAGAAFTEEQRWWLDAIRDTVVQAAGVHLDDLDEAPFTSRNGLDGAYAQFGADIQHIVIELDRELGA